MRLLQLSGFLRQATLTAALDELKAARAVMLLRRVNVTDEGRARVVVGLGRAHIILLLALVATTLELVRP